MQVSTVFGAIVLVLIIMNEALSACRFLLMEGSYMQVSTKFGAIVLVLIAMNEAISACMLFQVAGAGFYWIQNYNSQLILWSFVSQPTDLQQKLIPNTRRVFCKERKSFSLHQQFICTNILITWKTEKPINKKNKFQPPSTQVEEKISSEFKKLCLIFLSFRIERHTCTGPCIVCLNRVCTTVWHLEAKPSSQTSVVPEKYKII